MVMAGHQFVFLSEQVPMVLQNGVATLGLKILFIISGYLVTGSYMRCKSWKTFVWRRIRRLYPPLAASVAVTVLLGIFFTTVGIGDYLSGAGLYLWKNLLFAPVFRLPGVFENNMYPNSVNGSLWSLPVELMLYLILPLCLGREISGKRKVFVVALFLVETGMMIGHTALFPNAHMVIWNTDWLNAFNVIPYFFAGVLFCLWDLKRYCSLPIAMVLLVIFLSFGQHYYEPLNVIFLPYLVFSTAFAEKTPLYEFFNSHDYAYGIYLWGFPIQQALVDVFYVRLQWNLSYILYILLSLLVTWIFAWLTSALFEKKKCMGNNSA